MNRLDKDKNGTIEFEEFLNLIKEASTKKTSNQKRCFHNHSDKTDIYSECDDHDHHHQPTEKEQQGKRRITDIHHFFKELTSDTLPGAKHNYEGQILKLNDGSMSLDTYCSSYRRKKILKAVMAKEGSPLRNSDKVG